MGEEDNTFDGNVRVFNATNVCVEIVNTQHIYKHEEVEFNNLRKHCLSLKF